MVTPIRRFDQYEVWRSTGHLLSGRCERWVRIVWDQKEVRRLSKITKHSVFTIRGKKVTIATNSLFKVGFQLLDIYWALKVNHTQLGKVFRTQNVRTHADSMVEEWWIVSARAAKKKNGWHRRLSSSNIMKLQYHSSMHPSLRHYFRHFSSKRICISAHYCLKKETQNDRTLGMDEGMKRFFIFRCMT